MDIKKEMRNARLAHVITWLMLLGSILFVLQWCGGKMLDEPNHPHLTRVMIDEVKERCRFEGGEWTIEFAQSHWGFHDFFESYRCVIDFEGTDG